MLTSSSDRPKCAITVLGVCMVNFAGRHCPSERSAKSRPQKPIHLHSHRRRVQQNEAEERERSGLCDRNRPRRVCIRSHTHRARRSLARSRERRDHFAHGKRAHSMRSPMERNGRCARATDERSARRPTAHTMRSETAEQTMYRCRECETNTVAASRQ